MQTNYKPAHITTLTWRNPNVPDSVRAIEWGHVKLRLFPTMFKLRIDSRKVLSLWKVACQKYGIYHFFWFAGQSKVGEKVRGNRFWFVGFACPDEVECLLLDLMLLGPDLGVAFNAEIKRFDNSKYFRVPRFAQPTFEEVVKEHNAVAAVENETL